MGVGWGRVRWGGGEMQIGRVGVGWGGVCHVGVGCVMQGWGRVR